jgi:hypothetical protein
MNKRNFIILSLIIIVFLVFAVIYTSQKANKIDTNADRQQAIEDLNNRPDITITAKHQYKDGQHIYLGTFEVPTDCHVHEVNLVNDGGPMVEIAITYSEPEGEDAPEACIQKIEEREFLVKFEGPFEQEAIVTLNGDAVNLNIFEVNASENIEDIDISVKG